MSNTKNHVQYNLSTANNHMEQLLINNMWPPYCLYRNCQNPKHSGRLSNPFCGNTKGQPLWTNHMIFQIHIIHCFGVLIVFACFLVLKLEGWFDILSCHLLQVGKPMEKTCALTVDHGKTWVIVSCPNLTSMLVKILSLNVLYTIIYCYNHLTIISVLSLWLISQIWMWFSQSMSRWSSSLTML